MLKTGAAKADAQMAHHVILAAGPVARAPPTYAPQKKRNELRIDLDELRFDINTKIYNWHYADLNFMRPLPVSYESAACALIKGEYALLERMLEASLIDKAAMAAFVDSNLKNEIQHESGVYFRWTHGSFARLLSAAETKELLLWANV